MLDQLQPDQPQPEQLPKPEPDQPAQDQSEDFSTSPVLESGELAPEDFYFDGAYMVFTAAYHLKRGYCCNSDCRHCPYH